MALELKAFQRKFVWVVLFLVLPSISGCTKKATVKDLDLCPAPLRSICLRGKVTIQFSTNKGSITVLVDGNSAPVTAGNFVDLVKRGVFDGTIFHRVVKQPAPFIVQGGDPFSKLSNSSQTKSWTGNFIDEESGQARFIPLEIKLKVEATPRYGSLVTNPNELAQLELRHEKGSIAMARSQALNSASSQFYFALRTLPELDGRYAVFGRVLKGIDVIDRINQDDKILKATVLKK